MEGRAAENIKADHLHQAHLPRLLLLGDGGVRHQAAEYRSQDWVNVEEVHVNNVLEMICIFFDF